jgi:hypothetical protein
MLDCERRTNVPSLGIIEWKRTSGQYVAILQSIDRFEASSIHELSKKNGETILGGTLRGTDTTDWYALAYDRREWDFEEARDRAHQTLDEYRATQRY